MMVHPSICTDSEHSALMVGTELKLESDSFLITESLPIVNSRSGKPQLAVQNKSVLHMNVI